jgi:DNA repair protein RecN (Recombination protein N)
VLRELRVRDLGVIDDLTLLLGPGMTALTGETGAGKTLIVEAIDLLLGGRADPVLVRPGATEAVVVGRFSTGDGPADDEVVLTRVVPATGRSRAYINGRMATLSALAECGGALVDLHGQHASQALLSPAAQRAGLDAAGGVDHVPLAAARRQLAAVEAELAGLGGDERSRAREMDLLRYQLAELKAAGLDDPEEDAALEAEEQRLSGAEGHRAAASAVHELLLGDDGALDRIGAAVAAVSGRSPLARLTDRLRVLQAELADTGSDARAMAESFEDDPARLAVVGNRRQLLRDLRRKYGDTLGEVIGFSASARERLEELEGWEARAAALDVRRAAAAAAVEAAAAALGAARRAAAPGLAAAVETELRTLAMPRARFEVAVGPDPAGETVTWLLGANPGEPTLPLAKVASGGELARTMLALRLVLGGLHVSIAGDGVSSDGVSPGEAGSSGTVGPGATTLVFDEVDAGIGGEAAVAVGRALASLATGHQVLVVTHLPQVAAQADAHLAVTKAERDGRTAATVEHLGRQGRVVELTRMLSGRPDSATGRRHAEELLASAGGGRPADGGTASR